MRIALIQFPGANCERETRLAILRAGMEPIPFLWNEDPQLLHSMDGFVIVGGFSYEDRGRAGIVAAQHPVMAVIREQSERGKPVLGICNGAQILVESGMVPGYRNYPVCVALTDNKRMANGTVLGTGFYNAWIEQTIGQQARRNAFNRNLANGSIMRIPMAHAEGRFLMSRSTLADVKQKGLIAWQYCDEKGDIKAEFPTNPNGSMDNIAAITNHAGNVMAMMPHPERTSAGDSIFESMRDSIAQGYQPIDQPDASSLPQTTLLPYQADQNGHAFFVDQVIQDNVAFTIQHSIEQHLGYPIGLKRLQFWSVQCQSLSVLHQIQASGVLFNPQKEYITDYHAKPFQQAMLVCAKEDLDGQQKKQQLEHHFDVAGIESIEQGVLWLIDALDETQLSEVMAFINRSHILYNPISHECYTYE